MKTFLNPISMQEFSEIPPKEIQILKPGTWDHPEYGLIKITQKDIEKFVENFNKSIRRDLPIDVEHKTTEGAVGWFKQLINKGKDGLWATVEWTKQGRQLLKDKVFKYFSPEFYSTYKDPETGESFKNVLVGGALTNRPYFKGLKAIVLSELTAVHMKLEDILSKEVSELTDEEKEEIRTNEDKLTDEQKQKFADVLKANEEETEEKETEEATEEETEKQATEEETEEEEETDASEKVVQLSENTLKILERNAKEGVKAMAELRRQKAEAFVNSLTFSEVNEAGLILPKSKDKVINFLLSLSSEQAEKFKEVLAEMPKANLFKEIGKDEAGIKGNASEKATQMAEEKMKENDKLSFREALELALSENPDLAKQIEQGK